MYALGTYRVKAVTLRPSFGEIFVKIAKTPRPGLDLTTGAIQQRKCAERGSQSGRLHPVCDNSLSKLRTRTTSILPEWNDHKRLRSTFAVASSHRSAAKYSVDDNDSSSEPIYQGIVEMDIGTIRKVGERTKPFHLKRLHY